MKDLRCFTYSNDKICKLPIKGIAVSFFGLGGTQMFDEDTEEGKCFAEKKESSISCLILIHGHG